MSKRVLYVEDEIESFHGVRMMLADGDVDIELTHVGGVKEFWDAYAKGGWDLILLDVRLPASETEAHVDNDAGVKIVQKLKAESNHTPVITITGRWKSDPAWQSIKDIEFVRMVFKPIEERLLCKTVRAALRQAGKRPQPRRKNDK
jgi:DNA-binding NtrC family response regulator